MPPRTLEVQKRLDDILKIYFQNSNEDMQEAISALKKLNEKLNAFSVEKKNKLPVIFTEESRQELLNSYGETYIAVVTLLAQKLSGKKEKAEDAKVWSSVRDFLAADFNTLSSISLQPDSFVSLPELVKSARSTLVDKGDAELVAVGDNSNRRYALSFTENGEKVEGFFTPQNLYTKYDTAYIKKLAKESDILGNHENALSCFLDALENVDKSEAAQYSEDTIQNVVAEAKHLAGVRFLQKNEYDDVINTLNSIFNPKADQYDSAFADQLAKMSNKYFQYGEVMKAEKGSDISGRNVAMSRVANLLGINRIIAESTFMTMQDKDGHFSEGIFMRKAEGLEMKSLLPKDVSHLDHIENPESKSISPLMLKKIAELQILDYLCQNADRHNGNMLFQFSEDGTKLVGIQGIDNDFSFGTKKLGDNERLFTRKDTKGNLDTTFDTPLANLKVIPKSLEKYVQELNPEALKYELQDTGLKESEIQAAIDRLDQLKRAIENKTLRVVEDNEWGQAGLDLKTLAGIRNGEEVPQDDCYNTFRLVAKSCQYMGELARASERAAEVMKPAEVEYRDVSLISGMSDDQWMLEKHRIVQNYVKEHITANDYVDRIAKAQRDIHTKGSEEFHNLETSAQEYRQLMNELKNKPTDPDSAIKLLNDSLEKMKNDAIKYLNYKKVLSENGSLNAEAVNRYKQNTQARISVAHDIAKYCDAQQRVLTQTRPDKPVLDQYAEDARLEEAAKKMLTAMVYAPNGMEYHNKVKNAANVLKQSNQVKKILADPNIDNEQIAALAKEAIDEYIQKAKAAKQPARNKNKGKNKNVERIL